jgi:hypothetical protein
MKRGSVKVQSRTTDINDGKKRNERKSRKNKNEIK